MFKAVSRLMVTLLIVRSTEKTLNAREAVATLRPAFCAAFRGAFQSWVRSQFLCIKAHTQALTNDWHAIIQTPSLCSICSENLQVADSQIEMIILSK